MIRTVLLKHANHYEGELVFFFSLTMIIYAFTCGFSGLEQNAIIITRWVPIYWYHCSFSIFVETNRRSPTYLLHHFNLHLMLEFAYNSFDSKYGSDPFWSRTQLWCMGCCQAWWLCPACKYPVIYTNHHFIFHPPSWAFKNVSMNFSLENPISTIWC